MKKIRLSFVFFLLSVAYLGFAQVQIDKQIQLTGSGSDAKLTGIQQVDQPSDAVNVRTIQQNALVYATATGSSNAYAVSLAPAVTGYSTGMVVHFISSFDNTGSATLSVNGLSSITIFKNYNVALAANDIKNGQAVTVMYDGTNFQMLSVPGTLYNSAPSKIMFLSSITGNGDFSSWPGSGGVNGLTGGDNACTAMANAAGISGSFKVFASTTSVDAYTRFSTITDPIVTTKHELVYYSGAEISSSNQPNDNGAFRAIKYDEYGVKITSNTAIWTGSRYDGSKQSGEMCNNWTSSSSGFIGVKGDPTNSATANYWKYSGSTDGCNNTTNRIACIQQ